MAFYVNTHTPAYLVVTPWLSFKPPFQLSSQQESVFSTVIDWVERYTEYGGIFGQDIDTKTGGNAMDWCFMEFQIPSFTYELLTMEYYSFQGAWKHDHLVHWMQSSLPFYMYLLVNTENLYQWKVPVNDPPLPEGIPPPPLS
jgi:hypothetical protein